MKLILNDESGALGFSKALRRLLDGASSASLAVSYIQVGGWDLFKRQAGGIDLSRVRIICTDQLGITPPEAVRRALRNGVQIRNFVGDTVYHPKVYIAQNAAGQPIRFLLGSANLSSSAFSDSIEAGILSDNTKTLDSLWKWYNRLFASHTAEFTEGLLQKMEEKWRLAAAARAHARLEERTRTLRRGDPVPQISAEDLDTLEDVFVTVEVPLGLLNMDYAGNNIRNIARVREVLSRWSLVSTGYGGTIAKQRSELQLLGFAEGPNLTPLGRAAQAARSEPEVAALWCEWLQRTDDSSLAEINRKLLVAKRVFTQFWRLRQEVRDFFLNHALGPTLANRQLLKTIELLCNAGPVVHDLSLGDMVALTPLLGTPTTLPPHIADAVADYEDNKGNRGWNYPDRQIVPLAWRDAAL